MSDKQIALVAEGPTDYVIVEAALKAVLDTPFVLTLLQPEPTRPQSGTGWCGVLKWCVETGQRVNGQVESDPLLARFDLIILQTDTDIVRNAYDDCGPQIADQAAQQGWEPLPNPVGCPPASSAAAVVRRAIESWLQPAYPGPRTLFCLPAQASDAWLAAAVLSADNELLHGLECHPGLAAKLAQLPLAQRIRKNRREYQHHARGITEHWPAVKSRCAQAAVFEAEVLAAMSA
ncbi:MAG: hypothetical protein NW241_02665 [Bacteroidia bacterium]|nr:hypothetical protein [Bacteroidia bacterium]